MTTHAIAITTRDGAEFRFDCAPDQTLLEGAAGAMLLLPSQCRQGSCGACYAEVAAGDFERGPHNASVLPADAGDKGGTLLCCTFPRSDVSVSLPFDQDRIVRGEIPRRTAQVTAVERVGGNTVRLELVLDADPDRGSMAEFEPGQFMELEVPGRGLKRAYSLANVGNWEGRLEFLIRLQPNGAFSGWLQTEAAVGQSLVVHGPQGAFGLRENGLAPRWFVAGGTGLAPMLSMLRRMAEFQELVPARLYFGLNTPDEVFALDVLDDLKAQLPQLEVEVCVWRGGEGWQGFTGTPADAVRRDLANATVTPDIYVCGPPALIDATEAVAREAGLPAGQVMSERFTPSA